MQSVLRYAHPYMKDVPDRVYFKLKFGCPRWLVDCDLSTPLHRIKQISFISGLSLLSERSLFIG